LPMTLPFLTHVNSMFILDGNSFASIPPSSDDERWPNESEASGGKTSWQFT
jgi:hypothetical protein